jgi:hypothetical protein
MSSKDLLYNTNTLWIILASVIIGAVQWFDFNYALDGHWPASWCTFWLFLAVCIYRNEIEIINSKRWLIGIVILISLFVFKNGVSFENLLIYLTCWSILWLKPRGDFKLMRWVQTVVPILLVIILTILFAYAIMQIFIGDWGHKQSYEIILPWAHRNIAFSSLAVFCLIAQHKTKSKWIFWWLPFSILVILYQVRSVMLVLAIWGLVEFINDFNYKSIYTRAICLLLLLFTITQITWNLLPAQERIEYFAQLPDVVKSLDISYNFNKAQSSAERITIWSWTISEIQPIGNGPGSWKWDAQIHVNKLISKCSVSVRRAHSDVLQIVYELGWGVFIILLFLIGPYLVDVGRYFLIISPLFLFDFPMERAEVIMPITLLILFIRSNKNNTQSDKVHFSLKIASILIFILGCLWLTSQDSMGKLIRGKDSISSISEIQMIAIDLFPTDVAMNHIDVIISNQLKFSGDDVLASEMLKTHLNTFPNSISGLRSWAEMNNITINNIDECELLGEIKRKFKANQ